MRIQSLILVAGLAASGAAASTAPAKPEAPPAPAPPPSPAMVWQQYCEQVSLSNMVTVPKDRGAKGWELVGVTSYFLPDKSVQFGNFPFNVEHFVVMCFKRPAAPEPVAHP